MCASFSLPLKGAVHQKVELYFDFSLDVLVHSQREPWLTSATVFNSLSLITRVGFLGFSFGLVSHQTHKLQSKPKGTFTGVTLHKGIPGFGATSERNGFFRGPFLLYSLVLLQSSTSTNHHSGENTHSLVEFKKLLSVCYQTSPCQ